MNRDTTDFLNALDSIDITISQQQAATGSRQQEVTQDAGRLEAISSGATASEQSLQQTAQQGQAIGQRNLQRIQMSTGQASAASSTSSRLDSEARDTHSTMQTTAARWQIWATSHREVRLHAVQQQTATLEQQSYRIRDVTGLQ